MHSARSRDGKVTDTVIFIVEQEFFSYLGQHYTSCFQSPHQHNAALSELAVPAVNTNEEMHLCASDSLPHLDTSNASARVGLHQNHTCTATGQNAPRCVFYTEHIIT